MSNDYQSYFGRKHLQKFLTGGPREKGWREYKLPTGESVFLDPRFKDQRYYVNEQGDHVVPPQDLALFDVQDNIWESGTSMPSLEIKGRAAKKPGMLKSVGAALNPKNWGVDDYSQYATRDEAFAKARAAGEAEFMWNDDRYNTRKDTDPVNIDMSHPNAKMYVDLLNVYPELLKLINRGKGVDKINFDGAFADQEDRAHYNSFFNEIGVGVAPREEFIENLIAEMAHVKDRNLDNLGYNFRVGLERLKYGEDTYKTPGTVEYNTHRLYEPGIAMTAYYNLTPEKIKNIQNFLGVEADGYFGEQTYKALHSKYKDDPEMKRTVDRYRHMHPKDLDEYPLYDHGVTGHTYAELLHRDMGKKDKNSPFGWWFDLHETQRDGGVTYSNSKLQKFVKGGPRRKSVDAPVTNYEAMNNADQRAEYEAGWKAYTQGAQQWSDMLNREEERRGRELTVEEKEAFIEKYVKPAEGQRKFNYDRANDRRFDFLFDSGYTSWDSKNNAPVYNYRKPLEVESDRGQYAGDMDRFAKEWMGKEDTDFARALGFDAYSDKRSKKRAYDYARTKIAEQILAQNPQGDRNRQEWLKTFTPEQLSIIGESQASYNLNPDMGTQFRQGMANLFGIDYNDEDLSPEEAKNASRLGVLAPLGYTSNLVRGAFSGDMANAVSGKSAKPMTYGSLESYVQPGSTQALEELTLAGMDPLNLVGAGLIDDATRAGNIGRMVNASQDAAQASQAAAPASASFIGNLPYRFRRLGYNASVWQPEGEGALAKFIKSVKTPAVDEHLYGLGQGLAEVVEGERPFFEIFPMTTSQKQKIWAKQDAALREGEDFVKQWIYGPDGQIRGQVVDRAAALDPATVDRFQLTFDNNSSLMDANNILNANPSRMVSSRSKDLADNSIIPSSAKTYIANNRGRILGVNNPDYNITLRNQGFYHVDPKGIANTSAHETAHTFQRFGNRFIPWSHVITKHDATVTPYWFANESTPSGKMFADAMVEPKLWQDDPGYRELREKMIALGDEKNAKLKQLSDDVAAGKVKQEDHYTFAQEIANDYDDKIMRVESIDLPAYKEANKRKLSTWEASPKEIHSELMVARMNLAKRYAAEHGLTMEEAIQALQNPTDDMIDFMITDQGLNRFFKPTTSVEDKRKLIRMLPAAIPAIGAGMMMNDTQSAPETFAFGGPLLKFVGGGEHGGLDRWFAEKWVDVKTGKPCGRQEGENRKGYPACRPSKRVSGDTPKTASELSAAEKEKFKRTKTSSERIPYQHRRKEDGGQI